MARALRFRIVLPIAECGFAALFGAVGLWQRSAILSRPLFEGQTLWDSMARFHVWPWPYKFAVVSNMPAFMAGSLLASVADRCGVAPSVRVHPDRTIPSVCVRALVLGRVTLGFTVECGRQDSLDRSPHLHARQSCWRVHPTRVRRLSPLRFHRVGPRNPHRISLYIQILWDACTGPEQEHSASLTLSDSAQNPRHGGQ